MLVSSVSAVRFRSAHIALLGTVVLSNSFEVSPIRTGADWILQGRRSPSFHTCSMLLFHLLETKTRSSAPVGFEGGHFRWRPTLGTSVPFGARLRKCSTNLWFLGSGSKGRRDSVKDRSQASNFLAARPYLWATFTRTAGSRWLRFFPDS